jgi:hypothetical protein
MRTTITIEPDVAARIREEMRRTGSSFKQVVNEMLRRAYVLGQRQPSAPPFKVKARALGERPGLNYDDVSELLEQLEGPFRR